jgi:hypothetical protein
MPATDSFDYAIVRVVPRVERGEYINAGAIVFCRTRRFLSAAIDLDRGCLVALDPAVDVGEVERHLALIPLLSAGDEHAGPIARLSPAERFHWLVAPRSTVVQPSPVHCGMCDDPEEALHRLIATMVRREG